MEDCRVIDLCSGIGGIRLGLEQAGYKSVYSSDIEKSCKIVHEANFGCGNFVVEDIHKVNGRDLPEAELLCAGFPCQAFSIAGNQGGFEDKRTGGNIFYELVRIVRQMSRKPPVLFFENVKNLMSHDYGRTWKTISEELWNLGYAIEAKVLNSCDFGVPQNRERIYIVGFLDASKRDAFVFPEPISSPPVFKSIMEEKPDAKYYYTGKPYMRRDGKSLTKMLEDAMTDKYVPYHYRRQYIRSFKTGLCPTLTANMGCGGHNVPFVRDDVGVRKLTPRECARLQGFPDTFVLPDTLSHAKLYKMIGNSVTVSVIRRIGLAIRGLDWRSAEVI